MANLLSAAPLAHSTIPGALCSSQHRCHPSVEDAGQHPATEQVAAARSSHHSPSSSPQVSLPSLIPLEDQHSLWMDFVPFHLLAPARPQSRARGALAPAALLCGTKQLCPSQAGMSHSPHARLQEKAKQEKEGKGSAVHMAHQLRRCWDLRALNCKQMHVTKIMGGCLGLICNQLGSQRAAALWDVRNSFPLRKAGRGKADSTEPLRPSGGQ